MRVLTNTDDQRASVADNSSDNRITRVCVRIQNNILDNVQMDARNAAIGCQALDLDAKKSKECPPATSPRVLAAEPMKRPIVYLLLAVVTMLVGLASRRFRQRLPSFMREYSGDVLWALMLFLVVSFVLAGRPLFQRCLISLILAFAIEVGQLYHAPWIDGIRSATLGGLVLGYGFLWSDLVCYLVGITASAFAELIMRRWRKMRETNSVG